MPRGPNPVIPNEAFRKLYEGGVRPALLAEAFGLSVETIRTKASDLGLTSPHGPGRPKRYDNKTVLALSNSYDSKQIADLLGYPLQQVRNILSRERRRCSGITQ